MSPTKSLSTPFKPNTIAIVGKYFAAGIAVSLSEIAGFLKDSGYNVVFETETAQNIAAQGYETMTPEQIGQHADAAVIVGGDGTMLGIARLLAPFNVPLIGINQGRVGFMTDIPLESVMPVLYEMLAGKVEIESRALLEATVIRNGANIFSALACNDVVVSRGATAGMVELTVEVDGRFMYKQRSDGLIVATPTGSTAYALSCGGPIIEPQLEALVIAPICAHTLSDRPIVVSARSVIEVALLERPDTQAQVTCDGAVLGALVPGGRLEVRTAVERITLLHPEGHDYYKLLRSKLHWGRGSFER